MSVGKAEIAAKVCPPGLPYLRDGFSFFDPFFALFDQICSKTGFFGHICSVLIKFVQTGFC
jgi:hypothetical protein